MTATLNELPLEDLLAHLASRRATGTLTALTSHVTKKLFVVDGKLGGVASTNPRELLGHFLVGWGLLDAEQLGEAIRIQERLGTPLGRIVERMGLVDAESLHLALIAQAQETLLDLFLVPVVEQRFLANVLPTDRPITLTLPLADLVLEGRRRRRRVAELQVVLGAFDAVPRRIASAPASSLSIRDRQILARIDGTSDIEAVALACHLVPFHVAEFVVRGVAAGLVELARRAVAPAAMTVSEHLHLTEAALVSQDLRHCWTALELVRREGSEDSRLRAGRLERHIADLLARRPLAGDLVPRLAAAPVAGAAAALQPAEAFVLSRVNQRWTLREIQRITPLEELQFGVIVDTLERLGLIVLHREPVNR